VRILHINTYDCRGGAARAAYRLHDGLRRIGQDSQMFVLGKESNDPSVIQYNPPRNLSSRIRRSLRRKAIARDMERYEATAPAGMSFFTHDQTAYGRDPWKHLPENDVLQLHWLSQFVDYGAFFKSLPPGKPLVWTMHGMEAITGGCHYDGGCGKFTRECGACPQLGSQAEDDLTRKVWRRKQASYEKTRPDKFHLVSPSRWLRDEAKRSSLLSRFPCSVIPNGLDIEVFAPRNRVFARESLGIPPDARVALFVADGVDDPRKGFQLLAQAVSGLDFGDKMLLVSLGVGRPPELQSLPHLHLQPVNNDGLLSCIYSAADIFVAPSVQDNLPNTILESMACGVPVAGFAVGGIPDAVDSGVTGLLASPGDVGGLRAVISQMLRDDAKRAEMSRNCRRVAEEKYSLEAQARLYLKLYEELASVNPAQKSGELQ
jgi:glycosyltransferase involved in cell wall biosynthesis